MGIIVGHHDGKLFATHLPFLIDNEPDPRGVVSHFAIRNEHLRSLPDESEVLVIFPGPHAYVSPSHYVAEEDVPTWNYSAVHLSGTYRRLPDEALRDLLTRTVDTFEQPREQPFSLDSMDLDTVRNLARGVIGFNVETIDLKGGYKLSQDKLQGDVDAVLDAFGASHSPAERSVADEMRRHGVSGRTGAPSTDPTTWIDQG